MSSKVIFLEGPNYCGKSTTIRLLGNTLKNKGYNVLYLKEPGNGLIGEGIRDILLGVDINTKDTMDYTCRRLLYAAGHSQTLSIIKKSLPFYDIIIVDRYNPISDIVYGPLSHSGGTESIFMDKNRLIYKSLDNSFLKGVGCLFFMDISEDTIIKRINERGMSENKLNDFKSIDFKINIFRRYKDVTNSIQKGEGKYLDFIPFKDIHVIDADNSTENIVTEIMTTLKIQQ